MAEATATMEDTTAAAAAAADKAREAAEKRRKKILDASNERLGLVEGTYSKKKVEEAGEEEETATGEDTTTTTTTTEAAETETATTGKPTSSTSSKLAAMRRRRFKKAPAKQEAEGSTTTTSTTTTEVATAAAASAGETAATTTVTDKKTDEAVPALEPGTSAEETTTKKKYMGVAKVRRQMLKEKHKKQQEEAAANPETDKSAETATEAKVKTMMKKKKSTAPALQTLPIVMHVITVLLLFSAGLDVGLQQGSVDYYDGTLLQVHSELAPRRLGGLQKLSEFVTGGTNKGDEPSSSTTKPKVAEPEWQQTDHGEEDEFADLAADGSGDGAISNENLDPLFGVDLDKLSQGPGFYMFLARGAVWMHRVNLAIFYYFPKRFFEAFVNLLTSLLTSPPILCLTAILLRQLVGKAILGAKLPAKVEDETQHKDVLSMVKQFVTGFLSRAFPTAVGLYDGFTHLRADMYVVLCGLFIGMALSHNHRAGSPYGLDSDESLSATMEELVDLPEDEYVVPPAEGISDEL